MPRTAEAVEEYTGERPQTESEQVRAASQDIESLLGSDPSFGGGQDEEADESGESPPVSESEEDAAEIEAEAESPDEEESEVEVEEEVEPEPSEDELPQTVEVKVAGETREVPLEEAIRGYQRQQDYTRKTQELAEQRRELSEQVQSEREQYRQGLQTLEAALQAVMPEEPNWDNLEEENPSKIAEFQRFQQSMQQVQQEQARLQQEQMSQMAQNAEEKLLDAIPEWEDPEVAAAEKQRMIETAQLTYGYEPQELSQVYDPRLVQVLRDAMLYNEQTTKGRTTKAKSKSSGGETESKKESPTLKPGSSSGGKATSKPESKSKSSKALNRLAKSGRERDAATVLEQMLEDGKL